MTKSSSGVTSTSSLRSSIRALTWGDYRHPASTSDVIDLVNEARQKGVPIRVRGSGHSERDSVLSDAPGAIHVMLDELQGFELNLDQSPPTVTVAAGVSLGGDPLALSRDAASPNRQADPAASLFHQLHAAGYALPITGGISHQTISGFLATGADGGSLKHSFLRAVRAISYVNGKGQCVRCERGDPDASAPPFAAVLCSLGLLGIVVEVELEVEPTFEIGGMRSTQPTRSADFALAAPSNPSVGAGAAPATFVDFLRSKEYARALWWPQPTVERIEFWEAIRLKPGESSGVYDPANVPKQERGVPTPLLQVAGTALLRFIKWLARNTLVNEPVLRALQQTLDKSQDIVDALVDALSPGGGADAERLGRREILLLLEDLRRRLRGPTPVTVLRGDPGAVEEIDSEFANPTWVERLIGAIIRRFVSLHVAALAPYRDDQKYERRYCGALFRDDWHTGLPMDNPVDDKLMPVTFTEIWLPIKHADAALEVLREKFLARGVDATGTFTIELYAAMSSDAWLSPAYDTEEGVLRIDPFWCLNEREEADDEERDNDREDRIKFFQMFWETFSDPRFEARLHWAKALPADYVATAAGRWRSYPKLPEFKRLREREDPDGVFLTEYWRQHLDIAAPAIAAAGARAEVQP